MKIAVRLDDITPDMDWQRFLQFKALLDKYQVKPLIGVVPDNRDENLKGTKQGAPEDFYAYIKELKEQGWCVAMHGFQHIYTTKKGGIFPLNNFSEFAGLPFEKQKKMLEEGRKLLESKGIKTDIFMAPAHSYDNNTLKALKESGFRRLTDGFGRRPYEWKELIFYPISFKLSRTLQDKRADKERYSTMVIHTGTIKEEELSRYDACFQTEGAEWIPYEEYLRQPAEKRTFAGRGKEFCQARMKQIIMKILSFRQTG